MEGVSFAATILTRAVNLDTAGRCTEALICYQEGLSMLVEALKGIPDEATKTKLRARAQDYMDQAEKVKDKIASLKQEGKYREQISISENSTGHSYDKIFSRFFDSQVSSVQIDDPYIRSPHQCDNLLRLMELLVKKCPNLKSIHLTTGKDDNFTSQQKRLDTIVKSLHKDKNIVLLIRYSESLHDREIRLDNGWVIKIGRGLDFYKPVDRLTLGFSDFDLRPCRETTVDVFHRKELLEQHRQTKVSTFNSS